MNRFKTRYFLFYSFVLSIGFISCHSYYNFLRDRCIILNRESVINSDKFVLTVYYNKSNIYREPLERGEIRDGHYERKVEKIFYERSFIYFFSQVFTHPPSIRKDEERLVRARLFLSTLCEIRNSNNELILWYSYDDMNTNEEYMLLNDRLIIKNNKLLGFTKMLLDYNIGTIENQTGNGMQAVRQKQEKNKK